MNNFQITISGDGITEREVKKFVNNDAIIGRPSYLSGKNYVQLTLEDCPDNYTIESLRKTFEKIYSRYTIDVSSFE